MKNKIYKLQEGVESVNRIKLLMGYDMSKTLNENLNEQSSLKTTQPVNTKWTKESKSKYQKEHPEMVWDPEAFDETQPSLNQQGKAVYPKGKFVPLTPENMGLRGIPFGFSPIEYPTYLKKKSEIIKKYPEGDNRNKELINLKNQYYHKDFPSGITQQDFADRMKVKTDLTKQQKRELDSIENIYKGKIPSLGMYPDKETIRKNMELSTKRQKDRLSASIKYKTVNDYMDAVYEYDPYSIKEISKSSLEKWWDENGHIAELALWVIADIVTDGAVAYLSGTRQLYLLAKIVKFAGRVGLPVAVGTYDTIKNGHLTENGIVDFMFAVLPWAHSYFGIASKPSVELVESIVRKRKGLNLRNPDDVRKYMKVLTQEEKGLFREVAKLTKGQKENGIKEVLKDLEKRGLKKVYNTGKTVEKTTGKLIKPSVAVKLGKLGVRIAADITGIEIAKIIFSKLGLLDDFEKEKRLAEEFDKRKGTDLLIFIGNVLKVIQTYPNLNVNGIISKTIVRNEDDAIMAIINSNLAEKLLTDEDDNKVDKNGNVIK